MWICPYMRKGVSESMLDTALQREKIAQAVRILNELQMDCWLTFVRETGEHPDPAQKLIINHDVTWHAAFLLTKSGKRIAIVARSDDSLVRQSQLYDVVCYTDTIFSVLVDVLHHLNPVAIALNYAFTDVAADGLTHGMYLQLTQALENTPYIQRFISSAPLISRLRGRKTSVELARMRRAIRETEEIFSQVTLFLRPGVTERATSEMVHAEIAKRHLKPAWSYDSCPDVRFGPEAISEHSLPSDTMLEPGFLACLDLGVIFQDYCSDLQRLWYLRRSGETDVPAAIQKAFHAVKGAIEAGKAMLRPGVQGWRADAAARTFLLEAGYPEYQHALGHSVGRHTRDCGPLLGPCWAYYGDTPYYALEEGVIFTLELGIMTEYGYVGLEDEVLITSNGCEWFSVPQEEIYQI